MAPLQNFIANRLPVAATIASGSLGDEFSNWFGQFSVWFAQQWEQFLAWASQPHVMAAVLAWLITFWVVCIIILGLGFGPAGVVAGSLAASWQSYVYAGFTPAGGQGLGARSAPIQPADNQRAETPAATQGHPQRGGLTVRRLRLGRRRSQPSG
ncbi:hypothetical protein CHGG_04503 [Chaetomium globosum CBS 148.51]|uniref:Uncharacterized protein n=1 Tax=Chaetomium globosum (strain ATCC 6205 / CBS 148.51 / DSM 1962 / NBRC 6347 / NRRL 1970) TaxID=306901 RepID=Q2H143_CHAGB|nr:uncharacterized protein CHGG_04503 [Chaetomium globosum CBS 148.51]EAQ87884.1 hypothetical protein CHGG_04503 [Chaetomium globosum CBS 148.51]